VVMEGGVMLSRSYGSVEPFDRTITQLREHFRLLLDEAGGVRSSNRRQVKIQTNRTAVR